jgi:hypothetical protein
MTIQDVKDIVEIAVIVLGIPAVRSIAHHIRHIHSVTNNMSAALNEHIEETKK